MPTHEYIICVKEIGKEFQGKITLSTFLENVKDLFTQKDENEKSMATM